MKTPTPALTAAAFLALSACAQPAPEPKGADGVRIANPASEHCVRQGGRSEIREGAGGQSGVCVFADGRQCEEWALFRDNRCVAPEAKAAR